MVFQKRLLRWTANNHSYYVGCVDTSYLLQPTEVAQASARRGLYVYEETSATGTSISSTGIYFGNTAPLHLLLGLCFGAILAVPTKTISRVLFHQALLPSPLVLHRLNKKHTK